MVIKLLKTTCAIVILLSLVACAGNRGGRRGASDEILGVEDNMRFYGMNISPEEEKQLLEKHVYYFAFDNFEVNEADMPSLYAHAKYLINHPHARVRVEGHTDERGSREYNVALGENRANALAHVLMLKGVGQNQVSVVSYGKEKPAVSGHNESAWSQNRRSVIVYEAK